MSSKSSARESGTRKLYKPTLHFTTRHIQIGEDESADKVPVSELVHKGDMLLEFENYEKFKERGFEKQRVEAGDHTYYSEEKDAFFAEVAGYPRLDGINMDKDDGRQGVVISVEPLFKISPDEMVASVVVHPPLPKCRSLLKEDLDQLLKESGIVCGIDKEKLTKAKAFISQGLNEFATFPVARGVECGESRDAYLDFVIEIGPIAGKLLADGTIDFRERRIMVPVNEGDLLAKKIPAESGTPGKNVFGQEIEGHQGKDIKVKTSGYVEFSQDTLEVRATGSGVLSVVRDSVIKVSTKHKVTGDIDFATGNIESKNSLIITGEVHPGFTIKAEGDLEIGGAVSSATIEGGANVVIKGGITGQKSNVTASGDVDILFIEQAKIQAGGTCVIRKQCYYSVVHAGNDIRCQKESVVIGGELVAAGCISFGELGSEQSEAAHIAAGVVPERFLMVREMKKKLSDLQSEIIRLMQHGGARSRKLRQSEREVEDIKQKLFHINLIPGTGLYSRVGKGEDQRFSAEEYSDEFGIDMRNIVIDVFGEIQAGTIIRIGNRTLVLDKTINGRRFKLDGTLRRILAVPVPRR